MVVNLRAPSREWAREALLWGGLAVMAAGLYYLVSGFILWT